MLHDLLHACRLLTRAKGFTLLASLTLALGIGCVTAVFSIVNGVLLRPLPYRDASRLVDILNQSLTERGNNQLFATYADYREYSRHALTLQNVAAVTWAARSPILTGRGDARSVTAIHVSHGFFDVLGASAALGRTFTAADESGGCAVVLAHAFWISAFDADPRIAGQSIALDDKACTILGVMPRDFSFYPAATQLWTLIPRADPDSNKMLAITLGRLKPGITLDVAQAELSSLFAALHTNDDWRGFGPALHPLRGELTWLAGRNLALTLWILLAAVALVLLIACGNVANLLLARSLARGREFAIRAALGGRRLRLFRELLLEALPLAALGGAGGVGIALGAVRYFQSVNPIELPVGANLSLDWRVLLFALGVSALAAIAAGTAPAWKVSRTDLNLALKTGGRGAIRGGTRLGRAMAGLEMAFSVVLLMGAGLLMQSVLRMSVADLGFHPDNVTACRISLPQNGYRDASARWRFYDSLERAAAALPGVESAGISSILPPASGGNSTLEIFGHHSDPAHSSHDVVTQIVSAGYFETAGARILAGGFSAGATAGGPREAVVNQALVEKYFPHGGAIGSRIRTGDRDAPWLTITGIVDTERRIMVSNEMQWVAQPAIYRLARQDPPTSASLVIRSRTRQLPLGAELHRLAANIDPGVALGEATSLRESLGAYFSYPRFRAVVFGGFAIFALLLAGVGLHGVLAELVAQRTQEIGIRMALGARPPDVARLVALEAGVPVLGGLAIGIVIALWLGRYLASMLYGITPQDPATLAAVSGLLLLAAALALAAPARCAARVDPMQALRQP